jgi:hypothetical protein
VHAGRGWQIVVGSSDYVLPEDIPDAVVPVLAGIQYLTEIYLEGQQSDTSRRLLGSVANNLARSCHGVLIDPQQDTLRTPAGVKRTTPVGRTKRFSTLTFGWWFLDGPLLSHSRRDQFLRVLARELPECLPKRYGPYEPPQHLYAEKGRDHLLDFLDEHLATGMPIVWYPQWPAVGLKFGFPKSAGGSPQGFRSNFVEIDVDREVVTQTGWERQLRRFWRELSRLIRPFYGDVRTLDGRIRRRASYAVDSHSEDHPTRSWWWRGIPPALGQALVLGAEYQQLWPAAAATADVEDGLAFISTEDWAGGEGLTKSCGEVPINVAAKPFIWPEGMDPMNAPVNTPDCYPEQWPFESPFNRSPGS